MSRNTYYYYKCPGCGELIYMFKVLLIGDGSLSTIRGRCFYLNIEHLTKHIEEFYPIATVPQIITRIGQGENCRLGDPKRFDIRCKALDLLRKEGIVSLNPCDHREAIDMIKKRAMEL